MDESDLMKSIEALFGEKPCLDANSNLMKNRFKLKPVENEAAIEQTEVEAMYDRLLEQSDYYRPIPREFALNVIRTKLCEKLQNEGKVEDPPAQELSLKEHRVKLKDRWTPQLRTTNVIIEGALCALQGGEMFCDPLDSSKLPRQLPDVFQDIVEGDVEALTNRLHVDDHYSHLPRELLLNYVRAEFCAQLLEKKKGLPARLSFVFHLPPLPPLPKPRDKHIMGLMPSFRKKWEDCPAKDCASCPFWFIIHS